MSGGTACRCPERKVPADKRLWRCVQLKCNHSAFNGYRYTASNWSDVYCLRCRSLWRTKSDIAYAIPAYDDAEFVAATSGARVSGIPEPQS